MSRRSAGAARRPPAYPERRFGSLLGELLDETPASQRTIADDLGIAQQTLSGYRNGRYLPAALEDVDAIAERLAPSKGQRSAVREKLRRRWRADLLDAWMDTLGFSPADVRRALEDL